MAEDTSYTAGIALIVEGPPRESFTPSSYDRVPSTTARL